MGSHEGVWGVVHDCKPAVRDSRSGLVNVVESRVDEKASGMGKIDVECGGVGDEGVKANVFVEGWECFWWVSG